jgi:hypothetical protein
MCYSFLTPARVSFQKLSLVFLFHGCMCNINTLLLVKLALSRCRSAPFKSTRLWRACLHVFSSSRLEGFGGEKMWSCDLPFSVIIYNFVSTVRNTKSNAWMGPPNPKRRMGRSLNSLPFSFPESFVWLCLVVTCHVHRTCESLLSWLHPSLLSYANASSYGVMNFTCLSVTLYACPIAVTKQYAMC